MKDMCAHCGAVFDLDPIQEHFARAIPPQGRPTMRHGEEGLMFAGPMLCDACRALPSEQLGEILQGLVDRMLDRMEQGHHHDS